MDLDIPYWHPLVVHFPIALVLFGAAAAAVYAALGRAFWRGVALLGFATGSLGAWAAVWSGEAIEEGVGGMPVVEALVERHEDLGEWTLWVSLAAFVALAGATGWAWRTGRTPAERDPVALRLVALVLALAAAVLVVLTGHLGGQMVWGVAP